MENLRYALLADGTRIPHALLAPVVQLMKSLSAKWKLEILFALTEGHCRFGELLRATPGITQHMLAIRLRELEEDGFITRRNFGASSPRVDYSLTEAAAALKPIFDALMDWGRSYAPDVVPRKKPLAK